MEKYKIIHFSFFVFFSFLLFQFCTSPTSSELPEPDPIAKLEISLKKSPVLMYLNNNGCWYPASGSPKVIVSETNGVKCTISTVRLELMYEGSPCWPITEEGKTIDPFGSFSVIFWDFYVCYKYNRIKVTATGGDNYGHSISKSASFDLFYVD